MRQSGATVVEAVKPATRQASILVVGKDVLLAHEIASCLLGFGHNVLGIARSSSEAIEATDTHRPDLIVIDVGLEAADVGIAAASAIRRRRPTPIVFLIAGGDASALMRAHATAQPYGYVLKPCEDLELRATVEAALERHAFERELLQQRMLLAGVLSGMADAVAAADVMGNIVLVNEAGRVGLGETLAPIGQCSARSSHRIYLADGETAFPTERLPLIQALNGQIVRDLELFVTSDDHPQGRWFSVNAEPLRDSEGLVCGAVEVGRDVTQTRAARSELQQLSETDPLTGALNRRGFIQVAQIAFDAARASGRHPAAFFIDLNGMKQINDTLGHAEGDRLLMDVTWILRACFRTSDVIGRFGGDEFVVLAPDAADHVDVLRERLRASVDKFNSSSERAYRISMSVGVSLSDPSQPLTLEELVDQADKHMYEDKSGQALRRSPTGAPAPSQAAAIAQSCVGIVPRPECLSPATLPQIPLRTRRTSSRPSMGRKRILLVDDEPRNIALLTRLLAPLEHEVVVAEDGQAAITSFATCKPDLVLLDLVMPGLDGIDVLSHVRSDADDEHVPVIVLTAHSEREHRVRGLEAGADDFIEKPADGRSLRVRVTTLLQLKDSRDELRRVNAELKLRNDELRRLQCEQRELTSFVVHDLKNPLAAIWTNLEYASERLGNDKGDVEEALGDAAVSCERMRAMINDLLVISQLEESDFPLDNQLIAIWDLLREVFGDYARRAAFKKVTMLEPPLCNALVLADRALLRRVIENILDNSLRFTPEFGRMSLTACADEAVEISVSNTGPAIPLSERQRVFEKFARLDRMRSGNAGLGLYFCKRVLDALGGSIEITETPEWPTSFVLRLPTSS